MYPKQGLPSRAGQKKNVMSVNVPVFDFTTKTEDKTDIYPYGFATTSGELDKAITTRLAEVFPLMLELAAMEKEASLLAGEIRKTRRRVNALGYIVIPNYGGDHQIHQDEAG